MSTPMKIMLIAGSILTVAGIVMINLPVGNVLYYRTSGTLVLTNFEYDEFNKQFYAHVYAYGYHPTVMKVDNDWLTGRWTVTFDTRTDGALRYGDTTVDYRKDRNTWPFLLEVGSIVVGLSLLAATGFLYLLGRSSRTMSQSGNKT